MEDDEINLEQPKDPFGLGTGNVRPRGYAEVVGDNSLMDFEVEFVRPPEKSTEGVQYDANDAQVSPGDPNLSAWDYVAKFSFGSLTEEALTKAEMTDERRWRQDAAPTWNVEGYRPDVTEVDKWAKEFDLPDTFFSGLAQATSPDDLERRARQYSAAILRDNRMAQEGSSFGGLMKQLSIGMLDPAYLATVGGLHVAMKGWQAQTMFGAAVKGATIEGTAAGIIEGAKFAFDPLQTPEKAAVTILGSAALGGAFEGVGHGIGTQVVKQLDRQLAGKMEAMRAFEARRADLEAQGLIPQEDGTLLEAIIPPESVTTEVPVSGAGSSVGASVNPNAAPILRSEGGFEPNPAAPEQAGFGRWGTPMDFLARSPNPETRELGAKLVWDPASGKAQGVDAIGATRRIFEAGSVFLREGRMAALEWARANGKAGLSPFNPFRQPNTEALQEFFKIVAQVHRGVRESQDPHVLRAVAAYRDGYSDALKYLKNSSYNGPGSEGLAGLSNEDFFDIPEVDNYVMSRFSAPGWRSSLGRLGVDNLIAKFEAPIYRANEQRFLERAAQLIEKERGAAPKATAAADAGEAAKETVTGAQSPVLTPDEKAFFSAQMKDRFHAEWFDALQAEKAGSSPFEGQPAWEKTVELFKAGRINNAAELEAFLKSQGATAKVPPRKTPEGEFTAEEMFGGKAPKARNPVAKDFYNSLLKPEKDFEEFIRLATDPEEVDVKTLKAGLREVYEIEGIDKGIPKDPAAVAKRLRSVFTEKRAAAAASIKKAESTLPKMAEAPADASPVTPAKPAMTPAQIKERAAKFKAMRDGQASKINEQKLIEERARKIAQQVASKYVRTVQRIMDPATKMIDVHAPVTREFREAAKDIARAEFAGDAMFADDVEEAVEMILDLIAPVRDAAKDSPRARQRLKMDLKVGRDDDVLGIYDWNAEALYTTYRRQTAGVAGLLKAGYTSVRQLDSEIQGLRTSGIEFPEEAARMRRAKEADTLDLLKGAVLGTPPPWVKEGSEDWMFLTTLLRRYNFTRSMNNTGFLSFSEVMGSLVQMGPMRFLKSIPAYPAYIAKVRAGDPKAMESAMWLGDALMGHGSSQVRARAVGFVDRQEDGTMGAILDRGAKRFEINVGGKKFGKTFYPGEMLDRASRKAANLTSRVSGMAPIAEWLRTSVVGAEAQAWVLNARAGKLPYTERRLIALGVDKPMWDRIAAQLNKMGNVTSPDTGQARPFIDFSVWDDGEAANVFMNALDRNSRRLVLEGDPGHLPFGMDRPSIGLMTQFMKFPMNAWTKHTRFAAAVHDGRALAEALAMSIGGAMGHVARVSAIAYVAKDDGVERNEYLDKMMSPVEIGKAIAYYSAHGSVLPNVYDTGLMGFASIGGFEDANGKTDMDKWDLLSFGNTRASGNPANIITGNPTYQWFFNQMPQTFNKVRKGPLTEADLESVSRTFAPLGNHVATLGAINMIGNLLPADEE